MVTIAVTAEGTDEPRVAILPETAKKLVGLGAHVKVQSGAGLRSRFSDDVLRAQGAEIVPTAADALRDADILLKVRRPSPDEVKALRRLGCGLCVFTKLAVDNMVRSKAVLAAIFHIAYIYAHRIQHCTDVLIEVNPRHVRFYEGMLGFKKCGQERTDPRVNARAVLLRLELLHAAAQIARWGGHAELAGAMRSLYPYFFSAQEEQGIEGRLRSMG